jgi:hypothetical protein
LDDRLLGLESPYLVETTPQAFDHLQQIVLGLWAMR